MLALSATVTHSVLNVLPRVATASPPAMEGETSTLLTNPDIGEEQPLTGSTAATAVVSNTPLVVSSALWLLSLALVVGVCHLGWIPQRSSEDGSPHLQWSAPPVEWSSPPGASRYKVFHPFWRSLLHLNDSPYDELVAAHQRLPPTTCGLVSGREAGQWSLDDEHTLRFNLRDCRLRRPTHNQARQCLTNQSLDLIGDSIMRYQYVSLAHFLALGRWPEELGGMRGHRSAVIETEWDSWPQYYHSLEVLSNGAIQCRCFRNYSEGPTYERWHLYDADYNFSVSTVYFTFDYDLTLGLREAVDGWKYPDRQAYTWSAIQGTPDYCSRTPHPTCAYRQGVPHQPATAIIANTGNWQRVIVYDLRFWGPIRDAVTFDIPARVIWRGLTPTRPGFNDTVRYHSELEAFPPSHPRWELLDVFAMLKQNATLLAFWDDWHFLPFAYEEMNVFLLNMLCDDTWTFIPWKGGGAG